MYSPETRCNRRIPTRGEFKFGLETSRDWDRCFGLKLSKERSHSRVSASFCSALGFSKRRRPGSSLRMRFEMFVKIFDINSFLGTDRRILNIIKYTHFFRFFSTGASRRPGAFLASGGRFHRFGNSWLGWKNSHTKFVLWIAPGINSPTKPSLDLKILEIQTRISKADFDQIFSSPLLSFLAHPHFYKLSHSLSCAKLFLFTLDKLVSKWVLFFFYSHFRILLLGTLLPWTRHQPRRYYNLFTHFCD